MSHAYTVLWNAERMGIAKKHGIAGRGIEFLFGGPHTSQPSFIKAGVMAGDVVYPVMVRNGMVHILAQVVAGRTVTVEEFIEAHPQLYPPERQALCPSLTLDAGVALHPWLRALNWSCSDHVLLAQWSSSLGTGTVLPSPMLERLTYCSRKAERGVKGIVDGRLTTIISLQGIYPLSSP
ncbi:MAG: hypothetical protein EOP86_24300, partial [Verrucomicrobiaceae bacterium]